MEGSKSKKVSGEIRGKVTPPGFKKALDLFHLAVRRVPAYKDFIRKNGVDPATVKTWADFQKIPLTDKKNYILKYPLRSLFWDSQIPPLAYASSGSSGRPTFWFRGDVEEEAGGGAHEFILEKIFGFRKDEPTLAIICFSMGVWVAGNYTLASCRNMARRGFRITAITPGTEKEDIFNSLKDLAPRFRQVVLFGYPPFLMDVANEALRRKIKIPANLKVITAGDKFDESWRTSFLDLLNLRDSYRSLVSIYGSADAGILGHETPLTINLRRQALENKKLSHSLFGNLSPLPALVQYWPSQIFFEEVNHELVLTTKVGVPLVRYNIHDLGKVINYSELLSILKSSGLKVKNSLGQWRLPLLILKGRTDVAVTFYALNIFPEHIRAGIEDRRVARFLSGEFLAYNKTIDRGSVQKLHIKLGLARGVRPTQRIKKLVEASVLENLLKLNIEFRKLYSVMGLKAIPVINYESEPLNVSSSKGLIQIKGKKPRVFLA